MTPFPWIYALIEYGPKVVEAVRWLWDNKDNPDIIRTAHEEMSDTILPQFLEAVQGFSQTVQSAVTTVTDHATQLAEGLNSLFSAITGIDLFSAAQNFVQTIRDGVNNLADWARQTFNQAAEDVQALVEKAKEIVEPYSEVLSSLATAIVMPGMIPGILAGWAWRLIPECYKIPIINFLLDIVIEFLEATEDMPMFGALWDLFQSAVIGVLETFRSSKSDEEKVAITNKIAWIISGASPGFLWGFVKGFLKGIWEGIIDPFTMAWAVLQGLGSIGSWFIGMALKGRDPDRDEPTGETPDPEALEEIGETGDLQIATAFLAPKRPGPTWKWPMRWIVWSTR